MDNQPNHSQNKVNVIINLDDNQKAMHFALFPVTDNTVQHLRLLFKTGALPRSFKYRETQKKVQFSLRIRYDRADPTNKIYGHIYPPNKVFSRLFKLFFDKKHGFYFSISGKRNMGVEIITSQSCLNENPQKENNGADEDDNLIQVTLPLPVTISAKLDEVSLFLLENTNHWDPVFIGAILLMLVIAVISAIIAIAIPPTTIFGVVLVTLGFSVGSAVSTGFFIWGIIHYFKYHNALKAYNGTVKNNKPESLQTSLKQLNGLLNLSKQMGFIKGLTGLQKQSVLGAKSFITQAIEKHKRSKNKMEAEKKDELVKPKINNTDIKEESYLTNALSSLNINDNASINNNSSTSNNFLGLDELDFYKNSTSQKQPKNKADEPKNNDEVKIENDFLSVCQMESYRNVIRYDKHLAAGSDTASTASLEAVEKAPLNKQQTHSSHASSDEENEPVLVGVGASPKPPGHGNSGGLP